MVEKCPQFRASSYKWHKHFFSLQPIRHNGYVPDSCASANISPSLDTKHQKNTKGIKSIYLIRISNSEPSLGFPSDDCVVKNELILVLSIDPWATGHVVRQVLEQVQLFYDQMFFENRAYGVGCDRGDSWDASFTNQLVGDSLGMLCWLAIWDVNGNILRKRKGSLMKVLVNTIRGQDTKTIKRKQDCKKAESASRQKIRQLLRVSMRKNSDHCILTRFYEVTAK